MGIKIKTVSRSYKVDIKIKKAAWQQFLQY